MFGPLIVPVTVPEIGTINPEDDDGVRDTYQTFLNQMAATDGAIKKVIEKLRSSGKWDSTMVVLTADHGEGFDAGGQPLVSYHSNDALDVPWRAKNGSLGSLGNACRYLLVHIY